MARSLMSGRRERSLWSVVLAGVAVLSAACGSSDGVVATEQHEIRPALRPSGTDLPNGFEVPEDGFLIGTVFPQRTEIENDITYGWSAFIVAENEPDRVAHEFNTEAKERGYVPYGDAEGCASRHCPVTALPVAGARAGDLDVVRITAGSFADPPRLVGAQTDRRSGRAGELTIGRIRYAFGGGPFSLKLEEGTSLVAAFIDEPLGPRLNAILRVTGDPEAVLRAYRRQAIAQGHDRGRERPFRSWNASGYRVIENTVYCAGGCGDFRAVLVVPERGAAYLHIAVTVRS